MQAQTVKIVITLVGIIAAVFVLGWLGLQIKPRPFPQVAQQPGPPETVPLPKGLPAPVERFYRQMYGENVPVIRTAVITGRGTMSPFGLALPMRFRFSFEDGRNYRSDIDATFFGLTLFNALETYIDGRGWGKTPGGIDEGEKMDQAMNIRMWAEILSWFPAALITDPRVSWEPVDGDTALLVVPFEQGQERFGETKERFGETKERFVVRFDPETGKQQYFEAMRYTGGKGVKELWINGAWFYLGKPWIKLDIEDMVFNVEVREHIRANAQE